MSKVLYISVYNSTEIMLKSDGVMKKIHSHIECLRFCGNDVDYIYTDGHDVFMQHDSKSYYLCKFISSGFRYYNRTLVACARFIKKNKLSYDFIYIRHGALDFFGFKALTFLSKKSNCLYLEIPTFFVPKNNLKNNIKYFFNKYLHNYVYKIVIDCMEKKVFGIDTLIITNGTNVKSIVPRKPTYSNRINVLLVASLQDYHGVDKIIDATIRYYSESNDKTRDVCFHIVGSGPRLQDYIKTVKELSINNIIFYGRLYGEELDAVFNECELGISSLSNKELGITCSSTLKSKEYLAKGIPVISDTMLDVFYDNPKFFFYELKESFNIDELITFYDSVYLKRNKEDVINEIRRFAEETCDMFKVFSRINDDYNSFIKERKRV